MPPGWSNDAADPVPAALPARGALPANVVTETPIEPKQSKRAKELACRFEGFSLHEGQRVAAGADFALEKLCRYVARPGRRFSR